MNSTEVIDILDQIENLPTLPIVAQKVLKLISSPNSNMGQIAHVITRDQAIAARVIRLTNSAFYGLRNRVSSIQHAIVILGLNTVKNLVLGVSVVKAFQDSSRTSIFDREQFWLHTFSTAFASKLIAKATNHSNEEDFFLAGLLHDIGILVIDQFLHDKFIEILKHVLESKNDYLACEQNILGMTHGDVGGYLAEKWKINNYLINTIRYHHSPINVPHEAESSRDKIFIVHIADAKAREMNIGKFIERFTPTIYEKSMQSIGLTKSKLFEIFILVKEETNTLMKEWGL